MQCAWEAAPVVGAEGSQRPLLLLPLAPLRAVRLPLPLLPGAVLGLPACPLACARIRVCHPLCDGIIVSRM